MTELQQEQLTDEQTVIYEQLLAAGHDPEEANQWVLDYVITDEAEQKFAVTDDKSANWVLRKLAECDVAEAEIEEMMEAEIKAIQDRGEKLLKPILNNRQFFTDAYGSQLESWAAEKLKDSKKRSVPLIHGVVGFRAGRESLVVDDEEAAIATAEAYPEFANFVRVKKEIAKTELREWLKENNVTNFVGLDGLTPTAHIERGVDTFYIKPEMPGARE